MRRRRSNPIHDLRSLSKFNSETTITIICLISHDFMLSEIGMYFENSALYIEHNCRRIRTIPVHLDHCILSNTAFEMIDKLHSNHAPIKSLPQSKYHDNLSSIAKELAILIIRQALQQEKIDQQWAQAKSEHSIEGYLGFYKKYRLSKIREKGARKV